MTRIVDWSHDVLAEVVQPGDLVVDLTAGNGHDTLLLGRLVGESGRVVAFDIQEQALQTAEQRLRDAGVRVRRISAGDLLPDEPGASLVADSHANLDRYLASAAKAFIANLGYLPGGDERVITRPETTTDALRKACAMLAPGGRLAVVIYPGHAGGREEAGQVDRFFAGLPDEEFEVLRLQVGNRPAAPYLQVAEKR